MKRLFTVMLMFIACGCMFTACEDEPIEEYSYYIKAERSDNPDADALLSYHDIYIFEKNKFGDIVRRRQLNELRNLSEKYITEAETAEIEVFYRINFFGTTHYGMGGGKTEDFDTKRDNIIYLDCSGGLEESKYNEYINQ